MIPAKDSHKRDGYFDSWIPVNLYRRAALAVLFLLISSSMNRAADGSAILTVDADGSAQYKTVQAAIDAVPARNTTPVVIQIAPGHYEERVVLPRDKPFVTLRGTGDKRTDVWIGGPAGKTAPLVIHGADTRVENLTTENTAGATAGPQQAFYVDGKRVVIENVQMNGWQDTLGIWDGALAYFHKCVILGSVDFVYSGGTAVLDDCDILERRDIGGVIAAPSTPAKETYGLVFLKCHLTQTPEAKNAVTSLMRPWGPTGQTAFINCKMNNITPTGWDKWDGREKSCRAVEYGSVGEDGNKIDLSQRSPWVQRLTDEEAAAYTLPGILNVWDPLTPTSQPMASH